MGMREFAHLLTYRNMYVYLLFLLCFLRFKIIRARVLPSTPIPITIRLTINLCRFLYKAVDVVKSVLFVVLTICTTDTGTGVVAVYASDIFA